MDDLGTILGVWAHPDDETYLTAGLMAQAVRDGRRVTCVTATRGEGGSFDEGRWPSAKMTRKRAAEFVPPMHKCKVFMSPDTPPVKPRDEIAILFPLTPELRELKLRAIEAHVSQVEGMLTAFGQDFYGEAHQEGFFGL